MRPFRGITINFVLPKLTAISYRENIGDRTLIKELFINIFRGNFAQFELYIKTKQRRSPDFFNNFEAVAREWNGDYPIK